LSAPASFGYAPAIPQNGPSRAAFDAIGSTWRSVDSTSERGLVQPEAAAARSWAMAWSNVGAVAWTRSSHASKSASVRSGCEELPTYTSRPATLRIGVASPTARSG
jgi:hypothetical protein